MEDVRSIKAYWADHRRKAPANIDHPTTFLGKTIIVTGANTGLGFEAAVRFYQLGASKLVLAVRDEAKGQVAKSRILLRGSGRSADAPSDEETIQVWNLDMLSYPRIKAFAKRVCAELDRVDVVVLNAGIVARWFKLSEYGWEETLQVNVLSTTLLAMLLLPKLHESGQTAPSGQKPVLEFVGSGAQYLAKIEPKHRQSKDILSAINSPKEGWGVRQYNLSKLFVQYVVRVLAAHETALAAGGDPRVHILACCPGSARSEIGRDYNGWFDELGKEILARLLMRSTEEGSRTIVSGILVAEEGHGKFWQHDVFRE